MKASITHNRDLVTLSIEPQTSLAVKVIMLIANLFGIGILVVGLYEWLLMMLPIGIIWCRFFGWLALWNCFGKEIILISTKSLSYRLEYGVYQAKTQSREVNKAINISLIPARENKGEVRYHLVFESLNRKDRPEEIYRTALAISESDLECLKKAIRQLYFKKVDAQILSQPYMMN